MNTLNFIFGTFCIILFANSIAEVLSVPAVPLENAELKEEIAVAEDHDAFISYRRANSRHLAMLLKYMLEKENISAFIDVEDLEGGLWAKQLKTSIQESPNFILVLSNGTLERCKGDFNYTDFLHQEIKEAVDFGRRIIPVFDDFDFPPSELFSPEINFALDHQGVTWEHRLVDQCLQRLISYMNFPVSDLGHEMRYLPYINLNTTKLD